MNTFLISLPYIYPSCPLSIDHARLFVIADIAARTARLEGKEVFFPIASHYSGVAAHEISQSFLRIFSQNRKATSRDVQLFSLYKEFYGTPHYILKEFQNPLLILDFYSDEILHELKALNISADYDYFYKTNIPEYSMYVSTIFAFYNKKGVVIRNKDDSLALNYDDPEWRKRVELQIRRTKFIHPSQKNVVLSSLNSLTSKWGFLREYGFGVRYRGKIIDPMFDSELFTLFDLYVRFKHQTGKQDARQIFFKLLKAVGEDEESKDPLVSEILAALPCNLFIGEEHLKVWIAKKIFAEVLLLSEKYRTSSFFITGMGLLEGKRMSASKGNAVLVRDLMQTYSPLVARLVLLLTGGHPSRSYNYDPDLPRLAKRLMGALENYLLYLVFTAKRSGSGGSGSHSVVLAHSDNINEIDLRLAQDLARGYYKQVIIELCSIIPKNYRSLTPASASILLSLYEKYLRILLPGFLDTFYLGGQPHDDSSI